MYFLDFTFMMAHIVAAFVSLAMLIFSCSVRSFMALLAGALGNVALTILIGIKFEAGWALLYSFLALVALEIVVEVRGERLIHRIRNHA